MYVYINARSFYVFIHNTYNNIGAVNVLCLLLDSFIICLLSFVSVACNIFPCFLYAKDYHFPRYDLK